MFTGWWFGTFFIFPYIGNILPTDFHIFQRGWNHQPVHHFQFPSLPGKVIPVWTFLRSTLLWGLVGQPVEVYLPAEHRLPGQGVSPFFRSETVHQWTKAEREPFGTLRSGNWTLLLNIWKVIFHSYVQISKGIWKFMDINIYIYTYIIYIHIKLYK